MKTTSVSVLFLVLLGLSVPAFGGDVDAAIAAAGGVSEAVLVPVPSNEVAENGKSWWQVGLRHLMELVFLVLGIVATAFVRVLMKKYGFEDHSAKVNDVLQKAAGYAEQWAIRQAKLDGRAARGGAEKMRVALQIAQEMAKDYKLPQKGSAWWETKLEGWLGTEKVKAKSAAAKSN